MRCCYMSCTSCSCYTNCIARIRLLACNRDRTGHNLQRRRSDKASDSRGLLDVHSPDIEAWASCSRVVERNRKDQEVPRTDWVSCPDFGLRTAAVVVALVAIDDQWVSRSIADREPDNRFECSSLERCFLAELSVHPGLPEGSGRDQNRCFFRCPNQDLSKWDLPKSDLPKSDLPKSVRYCPEAFWAECQVFRLEPVEAGPAGLE